MRVVEALKLQKSERAIQINVPVQFIFKGRDLVDIKVWVEKQLSKYQEQLLNQALGAVAVAVKKPKRQKTVSKSKKTTPIPQVFIKAFKDGVGGQCR